MSKTTLQDIIQLAGYNAKEPPKDFHYYGTIVSEDKENNTYEVSINRDDNVTVEAARLAGAKVGDVVMVTVMSNGYATVTGRVGGDRDALKAAADADRAAQMADAVVADVEAANARIDGIDGEYTILNQELHNYKISTDEKLGNIFTRTTEVEKVADGTRQTVNEHSTVIQSINLNISAMGREISEGEQRISAAESKIEQTPDIISAAVSAVNPINYNGLINNGSAQKKDNSNFEHLTYDPTVSYGSSGTFKHRSDTRIQETSKEFIPISPSNIYECRCDMKSLNGAAKSYVGLATYDIDKNLINAYNYMYRPNTLTTLAADLKNGDTVVKFTSLANWDVATDSVGTYRRGFIFWNYKNSKGYTYPQNTYSRNVWGNLYASDSKVNKSTNTITLSSPWSNGTFAKGTKVSQSDSGAAYLYLPGSGTITPTSWTRYTKHFNGTLANGRNSSDNKVSKGNEYLYMFPPGTEYVRFLTLLNSDSVAGDTIWITNMTLTDDSTTVEARAEFKITSDGISSEVSKKIGSKEVISKINQSAETIKIQANKIEIDGDLIVGKKDLADGYNLIAGTTNPVIKNAVPPYFVVSSGGVGVGSIANITSSPVPGITKSFRITGNNAGANKDFQQQISDFTTLWTSGDWTFSAYVRALSGTVTAMIRVYGANQNFIKTQSVGTSWTKIEIPISLSGTKGTNAHRILFGIKDAGGIEYVDPRLTRGYATIEALSQVKTTATDAFTKANTANTNATSALNKLAVKDTRDTNQNPLWYINNYPKQSVLEFKYCSKIGVPTTETFCFLRTDVPWDNNNGGYPKQTAEVGNRQYVRVGTSDTAWGAWEDWSDYMTFTSTGGLTVGSNRVSATKAKINIKSDGIRMYDDAGAEKIEIRAATANVPAHVRVGTETDNATITDSGMTVYKGNTQVASFGSTVTLTPNKTNKFIINSEGFAYYETAAYKNVYTNKHAAGVNRTNLNVRGNIHCLDGNSFVLHSGFDQDVGISDAEYAGSLLKVDFDYGAEGEGAIVLGNTTVAVRLHGKTLWANKAISTSDERLKIDRKELNTAKDFINSLKTFSYKWDANSELWGEDEDPDTLTHFGVSAQDVMSQMSRHGMNVDDYSLVDYSGSYYGVSYSDFIPLLIRTIQDQQKEIDELKREIHSLNY